MARKKSSPKKKRQPVPRSVAFPPPDGSDRSRYLGGSDAAAVLGVSPWHSTYRLWCEKVGSEVAPDLSLKSWVEWGVRLEPYVADAFADRTGMKLAAEPRFLVHPVHQFMGGHIDRRIVGKRAFLECKTTNAYDNRMWGEQGMPGEQAVPAHYLAQCDHYMALEDFEFCYVAVLIGGSDFRYYRIDRNAQREKTLIDAALWFWDLVQREDPPPVQSEADARHRWKLSTEGTTIAVDLPTKLKLITLARVAERRKIAEKEEKSLRNEIIPKFEDAESLSFNGEVLATLTSHFRNDFDQAAFEKKHPRIAAKFYRELPTKRLKLLV